MFKWMLERTEAERWAIGVLLFLFAGIMAQWFGQRLSHALSIRRERITKRCAAAEVFRKAINPEMFKELRGHILDSALIQTFPELTKAVKEYRLHLGTVGKFSLDRAWKEYHGGDEEYPDFFVMYCIQENGPLLLKERLERLRKAGEIT